MANSSHWSTKQILFMLLKISFDIQDYQEGRAAGVLGWVLAAPREQCRQETQSHLLLWLQKAGTRGEGTWEDKESLRREASTYFCGSPTALKPQTEGGVGTRKQEGRTRLNTQTSVPGKKPVTSHRMLRRGRRVLISILWVPKSLHYSTVDQTSWSLRQLSASLSGLAWPQYLC